jgi:hypothetical protein
MSRSPTPLPITGSRPRSSATSRSVPTLCSCRWLGLRCWARANGCSGMDLYSASDALPRYLSDTDVGASYDVQQTAFQAAVNTTKPRWEWLEEKVSVKSLREGDCGSDGTLSSYPGPFGDTLDSAISGKADDDLVERPEHKIFGSAMLGGGRVFGQAHLYGRRISIRRQASRVD